MAYPPARLVCLGPAATTDRCVGCMMIHYSLIHAQRTPKDAKSRAQPSLSNNPPAPKTQPKNGNQQRAHHKSKRKVDHSRVDPEFGERPESPECEGGPEDSDRGLHGRESGVIASSGGNWKSGCISEIDDWLLVLKRKEGKRETHSVGAVAGLGDHHRCQEKQEPVADRAGGGCEVISLLID